MKKLLIITPRFPLPDAGACEQDRLDGILQWKRLGYDVRVIAKVFDFQDRDSIDDFSTQNRIPVDLLPYEVDRNRSAIEALRFYGRRLSNPLYWDGAAYEFSHKEMKKRVEAIVHDWKPDIVCFDYTYAWPLFSSFTKRNIPIATRSINFEPVHFLQEDGFTILNFLKFLPKMMSEFLTIKNSDIVFAITPEEAALYQRLGAKHTATLSLRSLPRYLGAEHTIEEKKTLDLFFFGSTYTVAHNRKALAMVLRDIAPELERAVPGKFRIHVLGRKIPKELARYCGDRIHYHGYVRDIESFLATMDIAVIPSLLGAGMQQKIFEPLCRGIPLVTSRRGLAGYPFVDGEHLLLAQTPSEFVRALIRLQDPELRQRITEKARERCRTLFSSTVLDAVIRKHIPVLP